MDELMTKKKIPFDYAKAVAELEEIAVKKDMIIV